MKAKEDAFEYLEKLIIQLLGMICSRPSPHSVLEVQDRIQKLFPPPIDEWVIDVASTALKQGKRKLVFPVEKIHPLLKEALQHKVDQNVTYYICVVLEYIANDMLQHVVLKYVKLSRHGEFSTQDIRAAMCYDKVFCDLFKLADTFSVTEEVDEPAARNSLTYSEVVEDYMQWERQYLRDLQMLLKVFREQLADKLEQENEDLELVFQSLEDIAELTVSLISQLEDVTEMTDINQTPLVGVCFLETAENWEFEVYDRYSEAFDYECRRMLEELLCRPDIEVTVSTAGHGFVEAVKFYFPKLLLEPFYHCRQYFDYISVSFANYDISTRMSGKGNKEVAVQKFSEMKSLVEGFDDALGQSYFNEFMLEDNFQKLGSGRKPSERHAYLFDAFICLCKPNYRRTSVVTGGTQFDYRLKEYFHLTKVEVRDKEDTEEWKNMFEIIPRSQPPVILAARSYEEKSNWMGALVMLTTKSMLDRILDRILSDEEKKHPLKLPPVEKYKFAVKDCDDNIIFDKDNGNHFLIKGATLLKLIERLTHHQYFDPNFINTFLTTYRSFCSPHEFLRLLMDRFDIPDPEFPQDESESIHTREMMKRFRKEYRRHVKLRVLNVMKQWVLHHFYDFERLPTLQADLEYFLDNTDDSKRSIFESVKKCLRKAVENSNSEQERMYPAVKSPPPIEYHIRCPMSEWNILTLHPIEIARQLTLLEFDYYRTVKPSELVGSVWTKKNKEELSPNLLKMIKHTTNVTRWFERTIVDAENIDERVAIVSRILEIMIVMLELNNFNGVLAVVSAMGSASVHRLSLTQGVSNVLLTNLRSVLIRNTLGYVPLKLKSALEEAQDLQNDHYKRYQEKLRSINPPCVPFFGMYLTNILHIEEGNLDFLPNTDLINFGKRRKVAEITSEIRQFQYSHYCFSVEPKIREFIEKLQPFSPDMSENEISDYLYNKSQEIEPRGVKQVTKFGRKWPDLNLKSPGIKPRHLPGKSHPGPLLPFSSTSSSQFSLHTSSSRMTLDSELDCVLNNHTPAKTLTPSSNPSATSPQDFSFDHSVFAPVLIGHHPVSSASPQDTFSIHSHFPSGILSPSNSNPPPLPPRRIHGSLSDSASPRGVNDEPPPPLPPRRVSPRTPNPPLPRRNSSSTSSEFGQSLSPSVNVPPPICERLTSNGPLTNHHSEFLFPSGAPKLPPKSTKPVSSIGQN
ncbi:Protein son of sevenless [Orchesella cincta]|uniref:Protein son of sevenless n=1 Tax=Orchesella cincta TaxID=48709 RepID=A0A1D2MY09_ORCCI|nr:Protein son of sevenless [Orchesella cincta]